MNDGAADRAVQAPRPGPARWTGRSRGGVIGNWIFLTLVLRLGVRWGYALLVPVAAYFVLFAPKAFRASVRYRRRVGWGRDTWLGNLWSAYRHFLCFGQLALDRVAIVSGNCARFQFTFEGQEHIDSALRAGRGVIFVSAHYGNWGAAAHLLARFGVPVSIVAYEGEAAQIRRMLERALKDRRFSVIAADEAADTSLAIMSALQRGEIVAMHADRCLGGDGEALPFFGRPARFAPGPFIVAALSGAPLIHTFAMREKPLHYRLCSYPPEHLAFGERRERVMLLRQWMARFVDRLEEQLRAHPLQWQNFYDFWEEDGQTGADSASAEDHTVASSAMS